MDVARWVGCVMYGEGWRGKTGLRFRSVFCDGAGKFLKKKIQ